MESFLGASSRAACFPPSPAPTPSPLLALVPGCRGGGGRHPLAEGPGGERCPAERSGEERAGARGRGAAGSGAEERGRGSRLLAPPAEKGATGGDGGRRLRRSPRGRSPGLRGGGGCLAARGSGGGGPRCVTFNLSLPCRHQQRQEGLATESGETIISCVESSRQRESFLGLSSLSDLVCVRARVCVPACLAARRSRPRAVHPKHHHPSSPPTPLPLPAPPPN